MWTKWAAVSACLYAWLSCLHCQTLAAHLILFRQIKMTMMMINNSSAATTGMASHGKKQS